MPNDVTKHANKYGNAGGKMRQSVNGRQGESDNGERDGVKKKALECAR